LRQLEHDWLRVDHLTGAEMASENASRSVLSAFFACKERSGGCKNRPLRRSPDGSQSFLMTAEKLTGENVYSYPLQSTDPPSHWIIDVISLAFRNMECARLPALEKSP
jgi:hypothetical protein